MDSSTLLTVLIVALGCQAFLRLVAKEKHRREKHLAFRLEEHVKALRKKQAMDEPSEPAVSTVV